MGGATLAFEAVAAVPTSKGREEAVAAATKNRGNPDLDERKRFVFVAIDSSSGSRFGVIPGVGEFAINLLRIDRLDDRRIFPATTAADRPAGSARCKRGRARSRRCFRAEIGFEQIGQVAACGYPLVLSSVLGRFDLFSIRTSARFWSPTCRGRLSLLPLLASDAFLSASAAFL